jgi:hypothetical protein
MPRILVALAAALVAGCGVETAGTAATAAAAKKQEIEQGRKTMDHAGASAAGAMGEAQERLKQGDR